jgi:hypothetical protein
LRGGADAGAGSAETEAETDGDGRSRPRDAYFDAQYTLEHACKMALWEAIALLLLETEPAAKAVIGPFLVRLHPPFTTRLDLTLVATAIQHMTEAAADGRGRPRDAYFDAEFTLEHACKMALWEAIALLLPETEPAAKAVIGPFLLRLARTFTARLDLTLAEAAIQRMDEQEKPRKHPSRAIAKARRRRRQGELCTVAEAILGIQPKGIDGDQK